MTRHEERFEKFVNRYSEVITKIPEGVFSFMRFCYYVGYLAAVASDKDYDELVTNWNPKNDRGDR